MTQKTSMWAVLMVSIFLMSTATMARPTSYEDVPEGAVFPRWRRPFFNPYPSWLSFLQQVYLRRHGKEEGDLLSKRPFFNVFPRYLPEFENEDDGED